MRLKYHVPFWNGDLLNRMNDRNGCWLNTKEIVRKLNILIIKLRDQKLIQLIEVLYSITWALYTQAMESIQRLWNIISGH